LGAIGAEIQLDDIHGQIGIDDCLIMYTDGATESFSPTGEIYGESRFCQTIETAPKSTAGNLLDVIESSLIDHLQGKDPDDDTTLLAIHRLF